MASTTVDKETQAGAKKEVVSVELPAPPGWKKKVFLSFSLYSYKALQLQFCSNYFVLVL
uniref:Uncharacterized protein n=1 Tax=Nelumbo nucifera TaxID=4432 RepID=A0A822YC37_NELNU|nr:TPA_asm: hypothetical protein HUJ06_031330 [Nelumbo nucifera]